LFIPKEIRQVYRTMPKRLEGKICPKNVSDALHYDTRRWRVLDGEPSDGLDLFAKQA
jgi:hypothetical protein